MAGVSLRDPGGWHRTGVSERGPAHPTIYANALRSTAATARVTYGTPGGNTFSYNNVVSNYGGNILWD